MVNFQFIVNDMFIQSLSIRAVRGCAPFLNEFTGPQTRRREPRGRVRNKNGVFQATIPAPNWLLIQSFQISPAASNWNCIAPGLIWPFQYTVKPTGLVTQRPVWLTIVRGRQRYANRFGVASIQSRWGGAQPQSHPEPSVRFFFRSASSAS